MSGYNDKICKALYLQEQVGTLNLGLKFEDGLVLDKSYFDCCQASGRMDQIVDDEVEIKVCDIKKRFRYTKELFKEYSDLFEVKQSYLFYESQNVSTLFFQKIRTLISRHNVGACLYTDKGISDSTRSLLPENMDETLVNFFYGLSLSWRFGYRVHYLKISSSKSNYLSYPSVSSFDWGSKTKTVLFVCIDSKSSLVDTSVLEAAINFCYNCKVFLVIMDDRKEQYSNQQIKDGGISSAQNKSKVRKSYFSTRLSKLKNQPIFYYLDPSTVSKLKELLSKI